MMKALFTRFRKTGIFLFFRNQWWLGAIIGFIPTIATFPPNIINPYRAEGTVCRIYEKETWMHITGTGSSSSISLFLVLNDSTEYSTDVFSQQENIRTRNLLNENVKIIYHKNEQVGNTIVKLKVGHQILVNQNHYLVFISLLCMIWILWGGMAHLIRVWKSIPTKRSNKIR